MKIIFIFLILFSAGTGFGAEFRGGKFDCEDDSSLVIKDLKATFHDISDSEKEVSGISILNSGKAVELKFDNGSSVLCHQGKSEILFL